VAEWTFYGVFGGVIALLFVLVVWDIVGDLIRSRRRSKRG
jgi:hypothetical protein